jgi:hypothetical protein
MIKVIDSFAPKELENGLEELLLRNEKFAWSFAAQTTYTAEQLQRYVTDPRVIEMPQFYHLFLAEGMVLSEFFPIIKDLLWFFMQVEGTSDPRVVRIKANMNVQNNAFPEGAFFPPHTDFEKSLDSFNTIIYYPTDADGDTLFFDASLNVINRVSPKKGRLVYFDGNILHAGQPPRNSLVRPVINMNLLKPDYKQ